MTLGGETDNSNPSRLIFSIKIPVNTHAIVNCISTLLHIYNGKELRIMQFQEIGTNPAVALLFPALHMFLISLEAHL